MEMKTIKRPTIKDIARETNLSVGAISQILSGKRKGRPENVAIIDEVIQRLGYRHNINARTLVSGKSRTIGLAFFFDSVDLFNAQLLGWVEKKGRDAGYDFIPNNLFPSDFQKRLKHTRVSHTAFETFFQNLIERRVEGIISQGFLINRSTSHKLLDEDIVVSVWEPEDNMPPQVSITQADWTGIINISVRHLIEMGHTNIHLLAGMRDFTTTREMVHAFSNAMETFNFNTRSSFSYTNAIKSEESGYQFIQELFSDSQTPPITALICADDRMAMGALAACYQMNIKIPDQLSIMGVDDIFYSRYTCPPLTTVRIDVEDAAEKLVEGLLTSLETRQGIRNVCRCELIVRNSTSSPPK